jgi:hypothetical protein
VDDGAEHHARAPLFAIIGLELGGPQTRRPSDADPAAIGELRIGPPAAAGGARARPGRQADAGVPGAAHRRAHGCLFAVVFQPQAVLTYVPHPELPRWAGAVKGAWMSLFDGFVLESGNAALDELLSRGGMSSMLTTVWLILSAMMFGAVMETTGCSGASRPASWRRARHGQPRRATLGTSFGMNVIASDQYIAIVLPGRMFRAEYARRGLHPKNLSRALEDAGTMTSALVPWNTCGAFMARRWASPPSPTRRTRSST